MDNVELIVDVIKLSVAGIGVIATAITSYKMHKARRERNEAEESAQEAKLMNIVKNYSEHFVVEAEKRTNWTGHDKLDWVLTKVQGVLQNKSLIFNVEKVTEVINNVVQITKQVNKRPKDTKQNNGERDIIQFGDHT